MRSIVLTGPAPVQILDVTGPLEVFSNHPGYHIALVASDGAGALQTERGIGLSGALPPHALTGPVDTLIVAGGKGAETGSYTADYLDWLRSTAFRARRVASICTGAFALAAAGLLDGKRAVTHWKFCDRLAREFPSVTVAPDPIFLRDGNTYTSAGISAGIDLSIALVEEDHGHAAALSIARQLVMFLVRPGGQAQYSHMLSRQALSSVPLRELQVYMRENLTADLSVETLADRIGVSPRHFSRLCLRETNMNPGQFVSRLRVEAAQQLIDSTTMGLKEVASACGFPSETTMRRAFQRTLGITAGEYTQRFKRAGSPPKRAALATSAPPSTPNKPPALPPPTPPAHRSL